MQRAWPATPLSTEVGKHSVNPCLVTDVRNVDSGGESPDQRVISFLITRVDWLSLRSIFRSRLGAHDSKQAVSFGRPAASRSINVRGHSGALTCHHEPVPDSRFTIRLACPEDAPRLQCIELATQGQFAAIGYDEVVASPPDSVELLVEYARSGRSWVAVVDDEVVGYILVGVLDAAAHIFHVCVHPGHQGHGIGKALIEQIKSWARSAGRPAITLATFYEVPWNGPLYEHLGFRVLGESELGPEMLARVEHDVAGGLSPKGQVVMLLDLDI